MKRLEAGKRQLCPGGRPIPGLRGLLVVTLFLVSLAACNMDDGFRDVSSESDVFLSTQGCISEESDLHSARIPFGVSSLEVVLEVFRGHVDMLLGSSGIPVRYFSLGSGPGSQKIFVGSSSATPVHAGTWTVDLRGLSGVSEDCDKDRSPDWRLRVQRRGVSSGIELLREACDSGDCRLEGCSGSNDCQNKRREFTFDLPDDASSLEVVLETVQGDADVFLGVSGQSSGFSSTNPGTGFDVIRVDTDEALGSLRGETLAVGLESWGQATEAYSLTAIYRPGFTAPASPVPSLP